jgi:hypothetical protein
MEEETVEQYIVRLKDQAGLCNFGARIEEDIRDQVVDGCRSNEIRTKLLEAGRDLTLVRVTEIASVWEISHQQVPAIEKGGVKCGDDVGVNAIRAKLRKFSKPGYSNTQKKKPFKENSLKNVIGVTM